MLFGLLGAMGLPVNAIGNSQDIVGGKSWFLVCYDLVKISQANNPLVN